MTPGQVTLTADEADAICQTLIEMACRLPLRYRVHAQALARLGYYDRESMRADTAEPVTPQPVVSRADSDRDDTDAMRHNV